SLLQDGTDGVLIDAGPADAGLVGLLRKTGVRRLRAVVLSHPAADHDGGAAAVLEAFPTDVVLDGGEPGGGPTHDAAMRAARRRDIPVAPVRAGQRMQFGRVVLRVRWPTGPASRAPGDPNDRAAVVEARIGGLDALLPADAEGGVLRSLPNLRPTGVLIVSHHGSTDEHLPAVLRRVRPQLAVISLGAGNSYGHPTAETIGALRDARTPTLRTDQVGTLDLRAGANGRVVIRHPR
ncbi:MAG: MBL fold metallo-hydrolase, partial [Solirubrobacteraceae bacterium]|nr:MBL fold metallo-hydrolase [Solirubrobacteraceae bacterium]